MLLAMVFIPHYLNTQISTMPEFLQRRYDQTTRNLLSYYVIFTILISWLGGTLYAGGLLISQVMGWPLWLSVVTLVVIATSFTMAGGLAAVVYTDSFQMIMLIGSSTALLIVGLAQVGGISALIQSVPAHFWHLFLPADHDLYPWYAIILGYPILGIWFWCTDQTIVQRALGARNIQQSQLGIYFAGWLKILDLPLFILPGIICLALHPGLDDPNQAYLTLVVEHLPVGMVGLIVATLMAALISTIDSALNSLSTVVTLDIYIKKYRPQATPAETIWLGRLVTLAAAILAIFLALAIGSIRGIDLFSLLQSIIGFIAPPMAAVFLIGVVWDRATAKAANITLIIGSVLSIGVGIAYLSHFPSADFWPHFLMLSFYLFVALCGLMVLVSLMDVPHAGKKSLPSIIESYREQSYSRRTIWLRWAILSVIMVGLYALFN
jgi:SSS family solute:Na+ symporter